MGLPVENDLLATTSEQIMEPESKFDTQKNLLPLTFQSINIVLIDHVVCHMTIFSQNLQFKKTGGGFKKGSQVVLFFFIHINKLLSLHVWNDIPLHFNKKKTAQKHHFKWPNLILNYQELLF